MEDFIGVCTNPKCQKLTTGFKGLFCANFSAKRGPFAACKSSWCNGCYKAQASVPFPIKENLDDEGVTIKRTDDKERFLVGRQGDNFLMPFQCDLCQFRNLQDRDPVHTHIGDTLLLEFIRRVNLDAFWSRETSTVGGNLSGLK